MPELSLCSKCKKSKPRGAFHEAKAQDRKRAITSQCRTCRSEAYFQRRYPNSTCSQCLRNRPLDRNKICGKCNEESALRQCRGPCGELLSVFLEYYGSRRTCKSCSRAARTRVKP